MDKHCIYLAPDWPEGLIVYSFCYKDSRAAKELFCTRIGPNLANDCDSLVTLPDWRLKNRLNL